MRDTEEDGVTLTSPIDVWELLSVLSREHALDLLPENFPDEPEFQNIQNTAANPVLPKESIKAIFGDAAESATLDNPSSDERAEEDGPSRDKTTPDTSPTAFDSGLPPALDSSPLDEQLPRKLATVGDHELAVKIAFRGGGSREYAINIAVVSSTAELEAVRESELARAKQEKPSFLLGVKAYQTLDVDFEDEEEEFVEEGQ